MIKRILMASAGATLLALFCMPHSTLAAAVSVTSITATSTPVYVNTGLATTSRAKVGDVVHFQLNLGGTPLIAPQINIFGMGSTTMSGSAAAYFYATTTASAWTEGPIAFKISVGGTAGDATSTPSAVTSGANVTFDKTGPTLSSVAWNDVDASTEFSSGDTLVFTFNETMATTTITTGNADTTLGLDNGHTFGTTPGVAWNTAGTILTLTLGTGETVATADTVDPSTAVFDAIGNADATASPVVITDNVAPATPTGLSDSSFAAFANVTLSSTGSTQIRYTEDGSTPTCSSGTVYSSTFQVMATETVQAVGCDEADNASSVASAAYTRYSHGGGGGGSSHLKSSTVPGYAPTTITNATLSSLMAQVAALQAQLAALTGDAGGAGSFNRDLDLGATGPDVTALQTWLIGKGFAIPAGATGWFGAQTQAALAAYQAANGISPAAGYFGPKTRAVVGH